MMLVFFVYIAGVIGSFTKFLCLLSSFSVVFTFFWYFIANVESHESEEAAKKTIKFVVPLAFFMLLLASLLPSERTIYMMGGAYIANEVVSSETADKVKVLINNKLDSYILEQMSGSGNK